MLSAPERGENQAPVDGVDAATLADLRSNLARLVPEDASAYDVGVAVQNYLRSAGGFTYSLSLDAGRPDESPEEFVIRSSDAHAWPELYIGGLGWTRFEPTPATRTGAPPALTLPRTTPTSTSTAVSTGRPSLTERERPTPTGPAGTPRLAAERTPGHSHPMRSALWQSSFTTLARSPQKAPPVIKTTRTGTMACVIRLRTL